VPFCKCKPWPINKRTVSQLHKSTRQVAERYAQLGVVTSAAELYTEIEDWESVVDCYRRAGKVQRAKEIVLERLDIVETPKMWAAMGDLTNDPVYYEKAIELSKGRFSHAYTSLHPWDVTILTKGDMVKAALNFRQSLKLRPLQPTSWFRMGTISM
jgi:hypothetical protein